MTEAAASAARPDHAGPTLYVQVWADSLSQVLTQIGGSPLPWVVLDQSPPALAAAAAPGLAQDDSPQYDLAQDDLVNNDLWILCACSGGLRGEMSLRLPAASTLRLAQIFKGEPAGAEVTTELAAENREAVVELLRQVAGLATSALKVQWGEVQLRLDTAAAPSWPAASISWLHAGPDSQAMVIEMHLSAALMAGLRAEKADVAASSPAAPVSASSVSPVSEEGPAKLALLMDVELALTLRFGSRRLLLREVLDLNPGAVVELDRKVEEAVDVLLDGRLVARGEIVVVNGNYGVRVTEVAPASP